MAQTFILYPGCLVLYRFPEYELSARRILEQLGYQVTSLPQTLCCGSFLEGVTQAWMDFAAYNLALAEELGVPVVTLCGGCTNTFRRVQEKFYQEPGLLKSVNAKLTSLGLHVTGQTEVRHLIQVLWDYRTEIGKAVVRPLHLNAAPVYPCQVYRPGSIMRFDHPLHPQSVAELIALTGVTPLTYPGEYQCCGSSLYMVEPEAALTMGRSRIQNMIAAGADIAVTACGNCHLLLQRLQPHYHYASRFPVVFLPQLLGLAMGLPPAQLAISGSLARRLLLDAR